VVKSHWMDVDGASHLQEPMKGLSEIIMNVSKGGSVLHKNQTN